MTDDEKGSVAENTTFVQEIRCAINRLSMERESNTPDYVLAEFLSSSFAAFNAAVNKRETHYGRNERPGNCKIDDKGAGEGPYELGDKIFIRGRSNSWELQTKADVELANHAYAEGRKAGEKDFKELLETTEYVVDRIGDSGPFGQMHALEKFRAWKKVRGIK